jgi:hypothetical protein
MTSLIDNTSATIESDLNVAIVDPLQNGGWDSLVALFPGATAFHTSAWARVLCRTYGHKPIYLRFDRGGEPLALVPLIEVRSLLTGTRAVCLPFTDFCGPLVLDLAVVPSIAAKLADLALGRNWKYIELRETCEGLANESSGPRYYIHKLSLFRSPSEIWEGLASSVRRAIRKAVRASVSIEVVTDRKAVDDFYQLHIRTRRRHGLPPQPFRFFINIHEEMIKPGHSVVVIAKDRSRSIAAAVFFKFKDVVIYKFGASDDTFQDLRPNNLLMWEAITLFAQQGCQLLHFGRTELQNQGVRRFKLGWGAAEEQVTYSRLASATQLRLIREQNHSFAKAIFRRLPVSANRLAGTVLYPHLD